MTVKLGSVRMEQATTLVIHTERGLLDVSAACDRLELDAPRTMERVLADIDKGLESLKRLVSQVHSLQQGDVYRDESAVHWAPCVTSPEKIICVGLNYRKHALETNNPIPTRPVLFSKFNNALAGHDCVVPIPLETNQLDYEAELAIIIGRESSYVDKSDALSQVFGYAVANDISSRDLQGVTSQWLLGKSSDAFLPIGPYIVTADEIPDPNSLSITCTRNGKLVQNSNTSDMIFSCRQIISYVSKFMTLKPGDVILTGTPEGVIMGYPQEKQIWLTAGDVVVTEIEKLGTLRYTVDVEDAIS